MSDELLSSNLPSVENILDNQNTETVELNKSDANENYEQGDPSKVYSYHLTSLNESTTYHYAIGSINSGDPVYSNNFEFTTLQKPTIEIINSSDDSGDDGLFFTTKLNLAPADDTKVVLDVTFTYDNDGVNDGIQMNPGVRLDTGEYSNTNPKLTFTLDDFTTPKKVKVLNDVYDPIIPRYNSDNGNSYNVTVSVNSNDTTDANYKNLGKISFVCTPDGLQYEIPTTYIIRMVADLTQMIW